MKLFPSKKSKWRRIAFFLLAVFLGLALFVMKEGEVLAYVSDNPQACVNCHVMVPEYNSWMRSSHRESASCNDCHIPHDNIFNSYFFKAKDGLLHASVFTTRMEPQVIKMRPASQEVVQDNCVRCHIQQITQTKYRDWLDSHYKDRTTRQCWTCHQEVVHGRVHGLSSIKYNIAPLPVDIKDDIVPAWLKKEITK